MESVSRFPAGLLRFCVLLLAAIALWSYASTTHAAIYYYIGGTDDRWEKAANWSTTPRGTGGGAVPTSGDTAVLSYSGTTVRVRSAASVAGLLLANTWTGALQMGTGTLKAAAGGIRVGSGRLVAGTGLIETSAGYTQTGGVVSGVQGTLSLSGSLSITSVSNTSPSFTSTGTIVLSGNAKQTFTVGNRTRVRSVMKNMTIKNSAAAGSNQIYASGSGMSLSGALTISQGVLDLTRSAVAQPLVVDGGMTIANLTTAGFTSANNVTLSGSLTVNGQATWTATGGTFTLKGNAPQPLVLNGGGRRFNNLTINNTGAGQQANVIVSGSGMYASGALTVTAGRLDLMTNSQALAVKGGITLANAAAAVLKTRSNITMSGSLTIGAASTFTATGGTFTLNADNPQTLTIASSNQRFNNVTINNTGPSNTRNTVTFATNSFTVLGNVVVTAGSWDATTNSIAAFVVGNITVADAALARFITGGNLTMSGSITVKPAGTFTQSAGTTNLNGTSQTLSGAMTLWNLQKNIASADTLAFYPGYTYTVSNSMASLNGASSTAKLTMNSPIAGQRWTFTPPVKNTLQYISLKDSNNTRLTQQVCLDCTDGGNNVNWAFENTPTVTGGAGTSSTSGGGSGGGRGGSAVASPAVPATPARVTTPVKAPVTTPTPTVKAPTPAAAPSQVKALQKRADALQKNIDKVKNVKAKQRLQKALDRLKKTISSKTK